RLRTSVRGLCAEGKAQARLFRAPGPGRRRHRRRARSEDRPAEQEASDAEVELGRLGQARHGRGEEGVEAQNRGRAAPFRAVSVGGLILRPPPASEAIGGEGRRKAGVGASSPSVQAPPPRLSVRKRSRKATLPPLRGGGINRHEASSISWHSR